MNGVTNGDTISLYKDKTCKGQMASDKATSDIIELTSSALNEGTINFYAKAIDSSGNESLCSTSTVKYIYDSTNPTNPNLGSVPKILEGDTLDVKFAFIFQNGLV